MITMLNDIMLITRICKATYTTKERVQKINKERHVHIICVATGTIQDA